MVLKITSLQNPLVKMALLLKKKSKARKENNLFIVEGKREISLAVKGGYTIKTVLFYPELISESEVKTLLPKGVSIFSISKNIFEKLAHRSTTEGIIAFAETKEHQINSLKLPTKNPLILVAEAPEKPGNIGAILRTADAANVDAVLIANPKTDLYNPNIIRSSVGCIFTTNIGTGSTQEIITFLQKKNITFFTAALHKDATKYTKQDYTKPSAIVVGTEATGLSTAWLEKSRKIIIPMRGVIDSLNVSVSAAVIIFEAIRQRDKQ